MRWSNRLHPFSFLISGYNLLSVEKGSYALVYRLEKDRKIGVGSLGEINFPKGFYVYIGSAFGPGGLKRVDRHRRLCEDGEGSVHWHIDYLSTEPSSELVRAYLIPEEDVECRLSDRISGEMEGRFKGFGCSDCSCGSHLRCYSSMEHAVNSIELQIEKAGWDHRIKNFITRISEE